MENHPVSLLRYGRHAQTVREAMPVPAHIERPYNAHVYWGPTHTGKSYKLRKDCPEGPEWFWMMAGKWWDGYEGQPGIVFDEYRGSWMKYETLLRVLTHGPRRVEIKGTVARLKAWKFRFSSNLHPKNWYKGVAINSPFLLSPLKSRLVIIKKMTVRYIPDVPLVYEDDDEPSSEEYIAPAVKALYGVSMK